MKMTIVLLFAVALLKIAMASSAGLAMATMYETRVEQANAAFNAARYGE